MAAAKRIIFVSTLEGDPWGGSEELWSRAALDLLAHGFGVSASVYEWSPLHRRVLDLKARGVDLWVRPRWYSWWDHPVRRLQSRHRRPAVVEVARLIAARKPDLAVFSHGGALPPVELLELSVSMDVPFVTLGQANGPTDWMSDKVAERYRAVLPAARGSFFVSQANRTLAEQQVGAPIANGEVVWNPVNVALDAQPPWPALAEDAELRLACVGRLHPPTKGQDILFEALAAPLWRNRKWRLSLYGDGPMRQVLERLSRTLGISERIDFAGFNPVEEIWATSHVLVMPSRHEGLPLAMVEAMLCARPVVATDVAGHAEIVVDGVTGFLAAAPTIGAFAEALERFWTRRGEAEAMGAAGARRIRELYPHDPVRIFSEKLKELAAP
jgi:glycosyltransferase involved in cell wall biosynthesis